MKNNYGKDNHVEINGGQIGCIGDNNIISGNKGQINFASGNGVINTSQTHHGNGDNICGDKTAREKAKRNITISGNNGVVKNINTGNPDNTITIYLHGNTLVVESEVEEVRINFNGKIENLKCGGSVTVNNSVGGDINCGGSVKCDNINGDVDAGGTVKCNNVGGNITANGSIICNR
jgi:uncharacterized protein YlzI (FlbEa/FlbD family)